MSATKPVVVAVDGSESASSAVVWAARTAVALGRPLHIATVVHIPAFYYSEPYLAESFKDELRRTATARLDSAQILARQSIDDDLEIVTELLDGSVSDRLIELSKSAYIIALGPRGHGEFTGLVVGSATVSVVSHGESPVAVVRGRTLDGRPPTEGPVVVGVDGSESSIEAIEHAFEQASARGATLIAVNVWSDVSVQPSLGATPDDPLWSSIQTGEEVVLAEQLAGFTERYPDVVVERVVARDRPVRVLSEYAETAQLIVVGSRGRGGFAGMLLGSTSRALLHTADCPVLIVRHVNK
ncbi:universal stress protein [Rhodococcus erythropolis]|jgi:nucleotide-binding universal stress UspA family protein|uniref:Universal stress protein n=1 Tax=Rhodococcus baikonurensis TaxID=172041 RepID=A0ABV5XL89_9NOCA|nr:MULTISPECIES: universal stress protein [Rhodococcus]NHP12778.1 universal stress protein [Rhodococcus sp. IC4_135]MBJ7476736.1 universal stress protein [Rhodococcus sp. (in: high G+C Gram-positive bacteria)]PBI96885.1 Universal stress protein [Rhodococcus erythropolis]QQM23406.1 universal stress protein [Rhodococcus sp. P-2]RQO48031.1 universal stress protein [Rhodococcus sp. KBW08]